ncbi:hypothetical protein [Aquimarina celericrescens]|uniref:Uncharacterized protein n=1 Tax=Aquimarina celericrescens TaxID=1964542 RepID=A0ABW5AVS7_9FLAO|nr:hypothetical protein [Aquimarina celericrescens]
MLYNILNLEGVHSLRKSDQILLNGGTPPECAPSSPTGCFTGPFYCNIHHLPICDPIDLPD